MCMENKNSIQEELKEISPYLANMLPPKKTVPTPDPEYFDQFSIKMLGKLKETPVIKMEKPKPIFRYIMGSVAAAAVIGVIFMIGPDMNQTVTSTPDIGVELAKLSDEDLEAFLVTGHQPEINADVQEQLKKLDLNEIKSFDIYNIYEN